MDIEHVALNVSEPVAMARWYVEHLGMRVLRKLDVEPFTHFLADGGGKVVLELYRHAKAPIPDYAASDPLVLHIAFRSLDVAADRRRLIEAAAAGAGEIAVTPAGDEMTFVRDPWGIVVQLVRRAKALVPDVAPT